MNPTPIHDLKTGTVGVRSFDEGILQTLGAKKITNSGDLPQPPPGPAAAGHFTPGYRLDVPGLDGRTRAVNIYFAQPEAAFRTRVFPLITIERNDVTPALHRWQGIGQLEYRRGLGQRVTIGNHSGFAQYESKVQAMPFDFTYTISGFDRYEVGAQSILTKLLRAFPPVGKLIVFDSLGLERSYEIYGEGGIANLQELVDPVTRVRGYALTLRVEGELDVSDPYVTETVAALELGLHRQGLEKK